MSEREYIAWKAWSGESFGCYSHEDAVYFARELAQCGVSGRDLRISEIGFGNGSFAGWARDSGWQWTGYEVNAVLLARARESGFNVGSVIDGVPTGAIPGAQDLVVAFDVLEHLDRRQLGALLTGVMNLLKPGGLFVARLPSGDSPFAGAIFHGDLTHRTLLGSSAIRQLAAEHGFHVVALRGPALPVLGLGAVKFLRRVGALLLQKITFLLVRAVMGNNSAIVSPNMLAVLRKPTAIQ